MQIDNIVQSAVGTILGTLVALASIWFKTIQDRNEKSISNFTEYYLQQGIDVAIAELLKYQVVYSEFGSAGNVKLPEPEIPYQALARINLLLDSNRVSLGKNGIRSFIVHAR